MEWEAAAKVNYTECSDRKPCNMSQHRCERLHYLLSLPFSNDQVLVWMHAYRSKKGKMEQKLNCDVSIKGLAGRSETATAKTTVQVVLHSILLCYAYRFGCAG